MLQIDNLTYRLGERVLFQNASARLDAGWRVGLVGRNGTGKSTLFKIIRGELEGESGGVRRPANLRVASLAQDAPAGEETPLAFVLQSDAERAGLLRALAQSPQDAELHERARLLDIDAAPARAAAILAGLGFDEAAQARPLNSFSGGWRMRVALAATLASGADWLLLDEPTNHLDLEAALWFEDFLRGWPGGFLLISHDRHLLNRAVTHILHLENAQLALYRGGYDSFEQQRREKQALLAALRARQEAERAHLQAFVDRFRAKASKARQAQSRVKRLEKLQPIPEIIAEPSTRFALPEPEELAPPLLTLEGVAVGYDRARPILRKIDARIDADDRIALLGANGNGKTTFARLLAGDLSPFEGAMTRHKKLRVGYFAQHQEESLTLDATPVAHLARLLPDWAEDRLRARLGQFGLSEQRAVTPVKNLSGGEKARLSFALSTAPSPHLLILDEPTNHLDIDARAALVAALNDFAGAVILISHDRHLIDLVADCLWMIEAGRVTPFDGDLDAYEEKLMAARRRARAPDAKVKSTDGNRRDERRLAAERRAQLAPLKKAVEKAEKALEALWVQKEKLDAQLARPETYNDPAQLKDLTFKHGQLMAEIKTAEENWLNAQTVYDDAQTADAGYS